MGLEFPLRSEVFVSVGNARWYSALQENALYREDLHTGDIRFIGRFPTVDQFRLHGGVICVDDILYFAPMKADRLDIYDIQKNRFSQIPIEEPKRQYPCSCRHIVRVRDHLYFVDRTARYCVYKYSLSEKSLSCIKIDTCEHLDHSCLSMDLSLDGEKLLFCDKERKLAVWFDTNAETFQTVELSTMNRMITTIQRVGDALWFSGDRRMGRYSLQSRKTEDFACFPPGFGNFRRIKGGTVIFEQDFNQLSENSFDESLVRGDQVIYLPRNANMLVVFDTRKCESRGLPIPPETKETLSPLAGRATCARFIGTELLPDGSIRMFSTQDGAFWDLDGSLTKFHEPEKIDFWKMDFQASEDDHICFEEPSGTTIHRTLETKRASGSAGRRIFEAILKKMGGHTGG